MKESYCSLLCYTYIGVDYMNYLVLIIALIVLILGMQRHKKNVQKNIWKWYFFGATVSIILIWWVLNVTLLAPNYDFVIESALGYIKSESNIWLDKNSNQVSCKGIMKSGNKYIVKCSMHDKNLKDMFGDVLYYGMVTNGQTWQIFYADNDLEKVKSVLNQQTDMY
jgi:hypothetical protein